MVKLKGVDGLKIVPVPRMYIYVNKISENSPLGGCVINGYPVF